MRRVLSGTALSLLLALAAGCDGSARQADPRGSAPATTPPAKAAQSDLGIPAGMNQDDLVSKPLIKDTTVADRDRSAAYHHDPRVPGGGLVGLCTVSFDRPFPLPRRIALTIEGPNAVKDPEEGEPAYYAKHPPKKDVLLVYDGKRKRLAVARAAVALRGVARGSRKPLSRPGFVVDHQSGQLRWPNDSYNYSAGPVGFMPLNERIQFVNTEFFACDIRITHAPTGRVVFSGKLPGYRDPKFPGERFGTNYNMKRPAPVQTRPITAPGRYAIACRQHPWHRASVLATDNPYVAVSGWDGVFRIDGIPEGTYTLDVWHPEFEPEQPHLEVRITAHKTAEAVVPFKPPALVTDPPPMPSEAFKQLAFLGPFGPAASAYPSERTLDFAGRYRDKDGKPIRWRIVQTDRHGAATLRRTIGWQRMRDTITYYAATIESPRAQRGLIGIGSDDGCHVWLNGADVYSAPRSIGGWNAMVVTVPLKPGRNLLLARLRNHGGEGHIVLTYWAKDSTAGLPAVPK